MRNIRKMRRDIYEFLLANKITAQNNSLNTISILTHAHLHNDVSAPKIDWIVLMHNQDKD